MARICTDSDYDVVVIGSGLYGIAFAAFYLTVHPECNLIILDKNKSLGGVWSVEKRYDTFWSQIGLGMSEFADMPMKLPEKLIHHFPEAEHVTSYLLEYCQKHVYNGRSLHDRMAFDFTVDNLNQRLDGTWTVAGHYPGTSTNLLLARKLVVATGITSSPNIPRFPLDEQFGGRIIHQKDFGSSGIPRDSKIQHITILGGGKSAADMVYACTKAGKSTTWIVRESGSGPAGFVDPKPKTSLYKNSTELGMTRWLLALSPLHYAGDSAMNWFLHQTSYGRWLTDSFWNAANRQFYEPFRKYTAGALPGFENLKPTFTKLFWSNDAVAIVQQPDFWPSISRNVQIHRADITSLSEHSVHLSTGVTIKSDAICCGTGWLPSATRLFTPTQCAELGLPYPQPTSSEDTTSESDSVVSRSVSGDDATTPDWSQLDAVADAAVLARYPILAHPPQYYHKPTVLAPYRLYQLMAPIKDAVQETHTTIILGVSAAPNAFRTAQVQAFWATAYLDDYLSSAGENHTRRGSRPLPSYNEICKQISALVAFSRRRYLNNGRLGNWLHYDMVPYTDALLREILGDREDLIFYGGAGVGRWARWWAKWIRPTYQADLNPSREEIVSILIEWSKRKVLKCE